MWRTMAVALPMMLIACGGNKDEESTGPAAADCSDPAYNPWAGTCVETFNADCFDPTGECNGMFDQATGSTTLEWASGASVETSINPATFGATTEIYSSTGALCSTGESANNVGGCGSQTIYTRASDGAQMTFCIQLDGSMEVTCPDGSTHSASSTDQGASDCQYGDAEPCTIEGLPTASY